MKKALVQLFVFVFILFGFFGCDDPYESIFDNRPDYPTGRGWSYMGPESQNPFKFANKTYRVKFYKNDGYIKTSSLGYWTGSSDEAVVFYLKPAALGQYILMDRDHKYLSVFGSLVIRSGNLTNNVIWEIASSGDDNIFVLRSLEKQKYLAVGSSGALKLVDSLTTRWNTKREECGIVFSEVEADFSFPEAEINVAFTDDAGNSVSPGNALQRPAPEEEIIGYADVHTHLNHYLGSGQANFVGANFSPLGIQKALDDCGSIHGINGTMDIFGMALDGHTTHDTGGYPDFPFWPTSYSETHQQAYYRWLERSWLAGQRVLVQQFVNNEILGEIRRRLPLADPDAPTNDMVVCEIQMKNMYAMQEYIDAQSGGPGRGWFRICTSSKEARQVISDGKMAVFLAIEVDTVFGIEDDIKGMAEAGLIPESDWAKAKENILSQLEMFYDLGVRSIFPVHAFNNGFAGAQLYQAPMFNLVNWVERGEFYSVELSPNPRVTYREGGIEVQDQKVMEVLESLGFIDSLVPLVPAGSDDGTWGHSNKVGLSATGEWLIDELVKRGIVVEVDHMSDRSLNRTLELLEEKRYPGVIASHTRIIDMYPDGNTDAWEQMDIPRMIRVMRLGGIISPMLWSTMAEEQKCAADHLKLMIEGGGYFGDANHKDYDYRYTRFNEFDPGIANYDGGNLIIRPSWYNCNDNPDDDLILGIPFATDVNGACRLPAFKPYGARENDNMDPGIYGTYNEVKLPRDETGRYTFGTLYPGVYQPGVTALFSQQKTGNRVFDIEASPGVAHYGLIPDLIKKLQSRPKQVNQDALFHSAEAYLRMLERTERYKENPDEIKNGWNAWLESMNDQLPLERHMQ